MHKEKNEQEMNYNTSKNISDDRKLEEYFQKGKKKTTTQMKQALKPEPSFSLQGFVSQVYEQSHCHE